MKNKINAGVFLIIGILLISFVCAEYSRSNVQLFQFGSEKSLDVFDESMCVTGQDFLIQIVPFGCEPAVVRSDLLEEKNVPVYCQLGATKINPLIDVKAIESISFSGEYPDAISGVGFHPAKAALGVKGDINSPVLNNIGYVVIVLREQTNASAMPDYVEGQLTAKLNYDVKNAFGIGDVSFYLPELTEDDWENKYNQYGFWGDRGYARAESVDKEGAIISVYDSSLDKVTSVALKKGEQSENIFIPGFDCLAGLKLKVDDVKNPDTLIKLRIEGDVIEVSKEQKFLENRCEVTSLNKVEGEKVSVKCTSDDGTDSFVLEIKPKIQIKVGDKTGVYEVGDIIYEFEDGSDKRIFLGYYGETANGKEFIIPVVSKEHSKEAFLNSAVYNLLPAFVKSVLFKTGIGVLDVAKNIGAGVFGSSSIVTSAIATDSYPLNIYARASEGDIIFNFATIFSQVVDIKLKIPDIEFVGFAKSADKKLSSELQSYYQNAISDYDTILEKFSAEKYSGDVTYGQKVLTEKIKLAWDMEQKETIIELCKDFEDKYSAISLELKDYCDNGYKLSSSADASESVVINGKPRTISFEGIYEPSLDEFSANVFIRGIDDEHTWSGYLQKDERFYVSDSEFIYLKELTKDFAVFDVRSVEQTTGKQLTYSPSNLEINLNDYEVVGKNNYEIRVDEINLKKVARVSLKPNINAAGTEVNFSFKIGIEKRAVELSPEKVKKLIKELDETIEEWTEIQETLGETVEGFKTACLGTGVVLTAKNLFVVNAGGKSIARQNVMRGPGGWYEKCTELVSVKDYNSIEQCLYENGDEIDNDVDLLYDVIKEQNADIKDLQSGLVEKKFLSEDVVDTDKFIEKYSPQVQEYLGDNLGDTIDDPDGKGASIQVSEIASILTYDNWKNGGYSVEQIRDIELYAKALKEDPNNEIAQKGLYESSAEVKSISQEYTRKTTWAGELKVNPNKIDFLEIDKSVKTLEYKGLKNKDLSIKIPGISDESPVALIQTSDGKKYIYVLDDSSGTSQLFIKELDVEYIETYLGEKVEYITTLAIYDSSGNLVRVPSSQMTNLYFKKYDSSSYRNNFKSSAGENTYVIRYYETEPYKGLPAVVPFDLTDGWYAATKQTLPVLGNIKAYDESGRVTSFWLCNVGPNGIEQFRSVGDDICQMINTGTGQPYNQFAGLTESEASKRVEAGVKALEQAAKQYRSGVSTVNINVGYGNINLKVGSPAVDIPDMQCQDFMSPKDCQLLFNVCDPVICPSSRCDLGGAYPVQDVIQSGIIGSLTLCLPNIAEGIYVPICLSGLHAGIEGLVSVFTSYRDCLQESLDTGQMVGVCDEIYSIYMCEFLWKQALPLADIAIPKVLGALAGQTGAHGGGEYLGAQSAWDNAQQSVNYFTQYYGKNSFDAFNARTKEEVGSEICKVYTSGVFADGANLLDSLTEPDSPPQFLGRFDEIPFTTTTVPPTSQYKVFYHIYAGKDSGAYYKVYLKGGTETSFYQDISSSRIVASGYISAGDYASETKDFTAPSGYKQLCIIVNDQEECGFKQVTTDFSVNYVAETYVAEQASRIDIKSESECISGSASVYNLITPNVQEGAEEVINPEIYNRGIIRVCATDNPGRGTDAYAGSEDSRWVEVGYCDDENVKCWLDTQSVENVIENTNIEGEVLEEASQSQLDVLRNRDGYISSDEFEGLTEDINALIDDLKFEGAIEKVSENLNKVFFNSEKADLYYLRGLSYGFLAMEIRISIEEKERGNIPVSIGVSKATTSTESVSREFSSDYVSPSFTLKLNLPGIKDVNYRYFNSKWYWSFSLDNWVDLDSVFDSDVKELSDRHKEIVQSLKGKSYVQGLKSLFDELGKAYKEGWYVPELSAGGVNWFADFSDEGFDIVKNLPLKKEEVWFKYESGKWLMSFDRGILQDVWYAPSEVSYDSTSHQATWQWNGKERGKEILFEETIDLINDLKAASFENGVAEIFDIYYSTASNIEGETIDGEIRPEIKSGINIGIFDEKQVRILEYSEKCEDCNKWKNEGCNNELCESIGVQSGNNCFFKYGTTAGVGECTLVKWEQTDEPSKVYDASSALVEINNFLKEYGEVNLDFNNELKQFIWDLRLNNILTEKEYNDMKGGFLNAVGTLRELKDILTLKRGTAH